MEALEFLKEHKRICNAYSRSDNGCCDCPLVSHCIVSSATSDEDFKKMTDVVEQWSKEHPRKTRQSVFLEYFPEAELDASGVITICTAQLSRDYRSCDGGCKHPGIACCDCRREFWMQEVE